ncbi:DUF2399 domain-containing protein [Streptomyces sp. NPDC051001]|uniref:DUF2399 domain-containing protein n=1 Tax=Streptomyces sp. NPDC051001 TaxID=3155795 RepID=UPI00343FB878
MYVCENPAVLRHAAGELGASSPPLICAEGRPSTAFHRLARLIVNGGGRLLYHGDFDWPGIDMPNRLIGRYGAEPWKGPLRITWRDSGPKTTMSPCPGRSAALHGTRV